MSLTVNICGRDQVFAFVAQINPTHIVSIGDPDHPPLCASQPIPDFGPVAHETMLRRFEFQDICHVAETSPTIDHIKALIALADDLLSRAKTEDFRVLYHCQAGISRSTAAAFILLVRGGLSYQQAFDYIVQVRGLLNPNMLMIKYADILMNQGGKMLEFVVEHRWGGEDDIRNARDWMKVNWP